MRQGIDLHHEKEKSPEHNNQISFMWKRDVSIEVVVPSKCIIKIARERRQHGTDKRVSRRPRRQSVEGPYLNRFICDYGKKPMESLIVVFVCHSYTKCV
jgi:hypothetical protein